MANSFFDWTVSVVRFIKKDTARSEDVNTALDSVSNGFASVETKTNAALKLPDGETSATFAVAATRKGKLLSFHATTGAIEATINSSDLATSVASAAASAATATTQAGLATTNGATQVSLATTQANNASASAVSSAASYDSFDDRYLGSKASNPTLDNDGAALLTGALYWNSAASEMRAYSGAVWAATYLPAGAYMLNVTPGASGNLLTSNGLAWTSATPAPATGSTIYTALNFGGF